MVWILFYARCSDAYSDTMLGYANSIRTADGGTHIDGLKASLTRTLNNLGKKSKLIKVQHYWVFDLRMLLTALPFQFLHDTHTHISFFIFLFSWGFLVSFINQYTLPLKLRVKKIIIISSAYTLEIIWLERGRAGLIDL